MKLFCPECRSTFDDAETVCPNDGTRLYRLDPADDPLVGATLDERYRIDWLIGEGGMGAVYRGIQLSVNREVAIKVLRTELSDREVALERFFREAKLVSELSHPNIVRVVDFGQDNDRDLLFLVMELVRGLSLGDLLEQGRLRANFALELAYQVCGALTEPHAAGIVHRDLKPDNLLLVPVSDGTVQVKVLDFGIARALERNTRLTATGMICGTPAYMAPEQSRNQELDARTDLYALGVLLYEMVAGLPPFSGQSSLQIMLKHIQEEPQRLREILPPSALPEQLEDLVHDMMSKDRDKRPQSAHEVRKRIEALRDEFDFAPVRIDTTLDEAAMFEEWLLPSLPTGNDVTHSETQALRRETGLFDHLDDGEAELEDAEFAEAATIGIDETDAQRSDELDEVNLADTHLDHMAPTTPAEVPVLEAGANASPTSPGPASAWTPGPRHMVPVKEQGSGGEDTPPAVATADRGATSELSKAGDPTTAPEASTRNPGSNTDQRPQADTADKRNVSTTATVLMSVAGSAVIMALFAVAGVLYFESNGAESETTPTAEPAAAEAPADETTGTEEPPEPVVESSPALSAAPEPSESPEVTDEAADNEKEEATKPPSVDDTTAGRNATAPRDTPERPAKPGDNKPNTDKVPSTGDEGSKDEPVADDADDTKETAPPSESNEKTAENDTPSKPAETSTDDDENVDDELENIFESGSLRSE